MAVMHQPMRRNMMAKARHAIDKRAQTARDAILAVDQLMRIGMADLAHETGQCQDQDDALTGR